MRPLSLRDTVPDVTLGPWGEEVTSGRGTCPPSLAPSGDPLATSLCPECVPRSPERQEGLGRGLLLVHGPRGETRGRRDLAGGASVPE